MYHSLLFVLQDISIYVLTRLCNAQGTEKTHKVTSSNLPLHVQLQAWAISIICMVPFKYLLFIFRLLDLSKYVAFTTTCKEKLWSWNCLFWVL